VARDDRTYYVLRNILRDGEEGQEEECEFMEFEFAEDDEDEGEAKGNQVVAGCEKMVWHLVDWMER